MHEPRKDMTRQEVYSFVRKHLLAQGQRSRINGETGCAYYGVGKLRCAVGCLIPRKEYRKGFEGNGVGPVFHMLKPAKQPITYNLLNAHLELLRELQTIHDAGFGQHDSDQALPSEPSLTEVWRNRLDYLADTYNFSKE